MAAWPRTFLPNAVGPFQMATALQSWGQGGKGQTRGNVAIGRMWTESYQPVPIDSDAGYAFLQFLRKVRRTGEVFTIDHRAHLLRRGGGSGSPVVNGAGQTGSSLSTRSWTGTDPVLRQGTIIKIGSIGYAFDVAADAPNLAAGITTLTIDPPILTGSAPADGVAITYSAVTLNAVLIGLQIPAAAEHGYVLGLAATFREMPT